MTAVDTNVIVRLLTGDDPKQSVAAKALFRQQPVWIAKTVLLETGWVLRSLYGYEESAIRAVFIKLLGLKNVHVEDQPSVAAALALTAQSGPCGCAAPEQQAARRRVRFVRSILCPPSEARERPWRLLALTAIRILQFKCPPFPTLYFR